MATRKTAPKGRKPRAGLRSQMKKATVEDLAWNSPETTEEEEVMAGLPDTSKSRSSRTEPVTPVATAGEGMVSLVRQFLNAQQQREERYLLELRGLRETILQSTRHAEMLSVGESPRMELPTPAAQRVSTQRRSAHDSYSPSVSAPREPMQRTEPKMPIFQQGEDIENYLQWFEHLARTWRWPEEEWSYCLVPLLTGQALEAYLAMDEEQAEVYEDLKEALQENSTSHQKPTDSDSGHLLFQLVNHRVRHTIASRTCISDGFDQKSTPRRRLARP
ncbi:zinc finger with KRAB and SCAN domains 3-like protein [Labeo rohita]|uniref:Zinc finger with KRAB and SCAN domains 3-like protein n=1 Tax=Labeo rohita TaxID=84645 RepID=A0A498P4G8_LABRO|nr:zinc finger with KRAB and SCAN domains 3-like protein [Labeo rohita]RXN39115.1 zinc finger with KRAB and SCAN domains 3-like protein [Labeo rohita]